MLKKLTLAVAVAAMAAAAAPAFAAPNGSDHSGDAFRNDPPAAAMSSQADWCNQVLASPRHYPASDTAYCRAIVHGY